MALSATPAVAIEFDAGVWTDVSALSRRATWNRGRSFELDAFSAGKATVTLANADRRFDPEHATGPHFGKLLPRKRIRIGFTYAATTYWKFYGYIDGWPQAYDGPRDSTVTVRATDAFKVFAGARLPSVWEQEVRPDAPRLRWRLGESSGTVVTDSSGDGYDGAYHGGATFGSRTSLVAGDSNGAIDLEGNNAKYITGPYAANPTDAPLTIEMWIAITSLPEFGNSALLYSWGGATIEPIADTRTGILVELHDDGVLAVWCAFDESFGLADTLKSTVSLEAGQVYHLTYVRSGAPPGVLYVNGVDRTSTTSVTIRGGTEQGGIRIGGQFFYTTLNSLNGTIDELAVYDTALSAARVLAHYQAGSAPWEGDTPKERIDKILDYIGWPAGDRDLDDGTTSLIAATLETDPLSHLQAVELSEGGRLFIDRTGRATLVGRQNFWTEAVYNASNGTFGDSGSELKYTVKRGDLFGYDDEKIVNEARVRQFGDNEQVAVDATSQDDYGLMTRSESSLESRSGVVADRADYLVYKYKDPALRMPRVEIKPERSAATLYALLGANDLGYRYTFARRPQGVGSAISKEFHVEAESGVMTPEDITFEWELSPAEPAFWIWDTSTWETGTNVARWGY